MQGTLQPRLGLLQMWNRHPTVIVPTPQPQYFSFVLNSTRKSVKKAEGGEIYNTQTRPLRELGGRLKWNPCTSIQP